MTPSFRSAFLALVLTAAPAAATTVADIVAAPETYRGQHVTVVGTVESPSFAYGNETVYTLSCAERRITVFGYGPAPAVGTQLQVTATVGWKEPDEEFTWPPVLVDSTSQPAP